MAKLKLSGLLYTIPAITDREWTLNTTSEDTASQADLFHQRMGHIHGKYLTKMRDLEIKGVPNVKFDTRNCEICHRAKSTALPFDKPTVTPLRTEMKLQRAHSDLSGKIRVKDRHGNSYYMTIIDDFTRKAKVILLKNKDEAEDNIKLFVTKCETKEGKTLETLRSDGGGEYTGKELEKWLQSKGITHELTPPDTPAANAIAERYNRVLKEMATSMLIQAKLPERYWGDAILMANHICNNKPHKTIMHRDSEAATPNEAWREQISNVEKFRYNKSPPLRLISRN